MFDMRRLVYAIYALTLACAAVVCAQAQQKSAPAQTRDVQAHEVEGEGFRLKGLDGKFHDSSEMKGDVLVVSFDQERKDRE